MLAEVADIAAKYLKITAKDITCAVGQDLSGARAHLFELVADIRSLAGTGWRAKARTLNRLRAAAYAPNEGKAVKPAQRACIRRFSGGFSTGFSTDRVRNFLRDRSRDLNNRRQLWRPIPN